MCTSRLSPQTRLHTAWLLPGIIFLLVAIGTLSPSSFFLHEDTPTQHIAAIDLTKGCWGYSAATLAPMVLLALPFAVGGPSPVWEMAILTLLGAAMAAAFYRLTARQTGSRRWAMLGTLWFASLPTILYYTRMHIGYPLAFFALGVTLHVERRYTWAGIALGLALTSHFNYVIPVAAWLGWSFLLDRETRKAPALAQLAGGTLAPLVALETARFLFNGVPFGWVREEVQDALRLARAGSGDGAWPATHLLRFVQFSNGWVSMLLIVAGLAYPAVRRPRVPLMDAVALSGWSLIAFYALRISLMHNTFLTPRMFSAAYPLLAVTAAFTLMRLWRGITTLLAKRTKPANNRILHALGAGVVALAVPAITISNALDALVGTRTGYEAVNRIVAEAGQQGLPVRYFGVFTAGLAFGLRNNAVIAVNETSMDIVAGDTRAVLVFEGSDHPMLAAVMNDPRIDPSDYTITRYPHRTPYRPDSVEQYGAGPATLRHLDGQPFARSPQAEASELVVWWPREPRGTFKARQVREEYIFVYEGGCASPKPFGVNHDRNYYDLLWEKAGIVGRMLAAGDLRGIVEQARTWIRE